MKNNLLLSSVMLGIAVTLFSCQGNTGTTGTAGAAGITGTANTTPGGGNSNLSSLTQNYIGIMDFSYPGGWLRKDNPLPAYPYWVSSVYIPDGSSVVDVYNFMGITSSDVAMASMSQAAAKLLKLNAQYQLTGNSNGYTLYSGISTGPGGSIKWIGAFRTTSNGVAGIILGSYNYTQMAPTLQAILSTVK
jgi:hypothetical protein